MLFKHGVNIVGVQPPTWYAIGVIETVYATRKFPLVVTSLTDSKHGDNSLHYSGNAADLRIHAIPVSVLSLMIRDIKAILFDQGYDVVLEDDHIHVEYQPTPLRGPWQKETN